MTTLSCQERALRLLAVRSHFRGELARKLAARGYPPAEVEAALDRCAAQGYLDDEATARAFVAEARSRRGWGEAKLRAELQRRGAAAAAIAAALAGGGDGDELARAREVAMRWRRGAGARRPLAALARHLDRRGFSRRAILAILESAGEGEAAELPDPDPVD
jgi:regulatory protein